jgi:hypothetical protein
MKYKNIGYSLIYRSISERVGDKVVKDVGN